MPDPNSVIRPVHRTLRTLVVATAFLYLLTVGIAFYTYIVSANNHDALCTFRADLETRVETSKDLLIDHPDGIGGISAEIIQQGIDNQQRTIDALDTLSCD